MRFHPQARVYVYRHGCPLDCFKWLCDYIGIDTNRAFVVMFENSKVHKAFVQHLKEVVILG